MCSFDDDEPEPQLPAFYAVGLRWSASDGACAEPPAFDAVGLRSASYASSGAWFSTPPVASFRQTLL
jgi:hypothetical protein